MKYTKNIKIVNRSCSVQSGVRLSTVLATNRPLAANNFFFGELVSFAQDIHVFCIIIREQNTEILFLLQQSKMADLM